MCVRLLNADRALPEHWGPFISFTDRRGAHRLVLHTVLAKQAAMPEDQVLRDR
jgi:hypothetical protein